MINITETDREQHRHAVADLILKSLRVIKRMANREECQYDRKLHYLISQMVTDLTEEAEIEYDIVGNTVKVKPHRVVLTDYCKGMIEALDESDTP